MAQGRLRKAVDKSIKCAVDSGKLDLNEHAAPIGMLRYMADTLDSDSGKTPAMRYVTPASFLNYCDSLGLTPMSEVGKSDEKPKAKTKMTAFTSSSKFAKAANE